MRGYPGRVRDFTPLLVIALAACGSESASKEEMPPPPQGCEAWQIGVGDGACCDPGTVATESGCRPAGVPEGACAEGFSWEDGGCTPILPAGACPPGEMAVPGDASCRAIAPCDEGVFGAAPDEPGTQYVDGSYAEGDSDGSMLKPWPTITQAVNAAATGAAIGIAAGTYVEDVYIDRQLRLFGSCPTEVTIQGVAEDWSLLIVGALADGTEIHDLAVTSGVYDAVGIADARVTMRRLWLHDAPDALLLVADTTGGTRVKLEDSLLVGAPVFGLAVNGGGVVDVARTQIADIGVGSGVRSGIHVELGVQLSVAASVIERTTPFAVTSLASTASIEGSVVRDTIGSETGDFAGSALAPYALDTGMPSDMTVVDTTIVGVASLAIAVEGSALSAERMTLRDPVADGARAGWCVSASPGDAMTTSGVRLVDSMLEGCRQVGLYLEGSTGTVEGVALRRLRGDDSGLGAAVVVDARESMLASSSLVMVDSLIEDVDDLALMVEGSSAQLDHVATESVAAGGDGSVIQVQRENATGLDALLSLDRCRVRGGLSSGVLINGASATIARTAVVDTVASVEGLFGSGISVVSDQVASQLTVVASTVDGNALAGVASYGGIVDVTDTTLKCNAYALLAEDNFAFEPKVTDGGGNRCGCEQDAVCKIQSVGLAPPEAVEPGVDSQGP